MMDWIDVKEKLPEEMTNTTSLVCNANGISFDEREPVIAYYDHDDKTWYSIAWWNFKLYGKPKVTHWMPLPDPFGEKKYDR